MSSDILIERVPSNALHVVVVLSDLIDAFT